MTGDQTADASQSLNADVIHYILDFMAQADVLCFAHVCGSWRSAAIRHTNYYRPIHLGGLGHDSVAAFVADLNDAHKHSQRISLSLYLPTISAEQHLSCLLRDVLPALTAALGHTKKLRISFPDNYEWHLYSALTQPAPLLERLHLTIRDDGTYGPSARKGTTALRSDLFGAMSPRLYSVQLAGVSLGTVPLAAFSRVRAASLECTRPIRMLPVDGFFPFLRKLDLCCGDVETWETERQISVTLPATLVTINVRQRCQTLVIPGLERVQNVGILVEPSPTQSEPEYRPFFRPLDTASELTLRVYYEDVDDFFPAWDDAPSAMRVMFTDASRRTVRTFYPDVDLYDSDEGMQDDWNMSYTGLNFLSELGTTITSISIDHEFLLFLCEVLYHLPALKSLDINLDRLRGPFWITEATFDHDDWASGDRTPPPFPTSKLSHQAAIRTVDKLAASGMINKFDEGDEEHCIECPALRTVTLRTSYKGTEVHTRQLAHFGRALLKCHPRLVLCGVELACARYGKLHESVFHPIVHEKPAVPLKRRKDDYAAENYYGESDADSDY